MLAIALNSFLSHNSCKISLTFFKDMSTSNADKILIFCKGLFLFTYVTLSFVQKSPRDESHQTRYLAFCNNTHMMTIEVFVTGSQVDSMVLIKLLHTTQNPQNNIFLSWSQWSYCSYGSKTTIEKVITEMLIIFN